MENRTKQSAELRKRAESVLLDKIPENITTLLPEEIQKTVHDLRVHQVELEMQNEELRRTLVDLSVSQAHHFNFYNFAPVGYCTISEKGLILEANLTSASLLGLTRSELIDQPLTNFIHQQDQDLYYLFRKLLLGHEAVKPCDLRVVRGDNAVFWARLRAVAVQDSDGSPVYRLILSDITEYKHAEEEAQRNESRLRRLVDILQHPSDTIQGFLDYVLEQAIQLTGSKVGYIYHYHGDRKELVLNSWSKEVLPACTVVNPQTCYALEKTGIWGEAVRQRRPLIVNDFLAANPLKKGYPEGHVQLSKFVTIPIFKGERIVSVVGLANKETDYDETDVLQISLLMDAVWKVTDSMQAEEALRESEARNREQEVLRISEARFREVLEHSQDAAYKRNLQTTFYEYLSPVFAQLSGYSPDEITTLPIEAVLDSIHRDDVTEVERALIEAMTDIIEKPHHLEYRFKHKDGQYRWFQDRFSVRRDADGHPVAFIGSVSDITDRKRAEKAFHEEKRKFEFLSEVSPSGIWQTDLVGNNTYVSTRWSEITGISKKDAWGSGWAQGIHADDKEEVIKGWLLAAHSAAPYRSEFRFVKTDDKVIWVLCLAQRFSDPIELDNVGWIGTITDITERKQAEEALQASLAEKEVLLREVHHRVKNNMAAIIGLLNLQQNAIDDPQARSIMTDLSSRIRAMSLVHEKLYRSATLSKIDFQEYLQSLISHLRTSFSSPQIKCVIETYGVEMPLDLAVPCGMIINELITNALKYAFPKERAEQGIENRISVSLHHENSIFTLSVADNGVGLPPGFDLNNTATLGLTLVQMIGQHQLGGRYVIDQVGGTKFTLTFALQDGGKPYA